MPPRACTLTLLALALLAPTAAAAVGDAPLTVVVEALRIGDVLRYEPEDGAPDSWTLSPVAISTATDRHGIARASVEWRTDVRDDTGMTRTEVCHKAGTTVVRRTEGAGHAGAPGAAGEDVAGPSLVSGGEAEVALAWAADFPTVCADAHLLLPLAGLAGEHRAGDPLDLARFPLVPAPRESVSEPAAPTTYQGRAALEYVYNATDGRRASLVVADGLPGFASWGWRDGARMRLAGWTEGAGGLVPVAAMPVVPQTSSVDAPRRTFIDAPLSLPLPFARALTALLDDPSIGLKAFLDAHPDARLVGAVYDERMPAREPGHVGTPQGSANAGDAYATRGGWSLHFADARAGYRATAVLVQGVQGVGTAPQDVVRTYDDGSAAGVALAPGLRILDGAALARLAQGEGFAPGAVAHLAYAAQGGAARIRLSDVSQEVEGAPGDDAGHLLLIDAARAETLTVWSAQRATASGGLLDAATLTPTGAAAPATSTANGGAALAARDVTPFLVVGVTGIALLALVALAAKLVLFPLYTRLVRSRVLDHPVRAHLLDAIRQEPGVRLAALEQETRAGPGATRHHLDTLVKHSHVVEVRLGHALHYYAAGALPREAAARHAILQNESTRRVFDLYEREPATSLREAARRLDMSAPSVHRIRKRLERGGLLRPPQ